MYHPELAVYNKVYDTERNACLSSAEVSSDITGIFWIASVHSRLAAHCLMLGVALVGLAEAYGYDASGCDTSKWATAYARERGLDVRTGAIDELMMSSASFDVVVLNHALEHISQPLLVLTELHRILKPGGVLAVGVRNFECLFSKQLHLRWAGLLPDQHIWHFTQNSLQRLLVHASFQVQSIGVAPYVHRHANPVKDFALRAVSEIAYRTHTSDNLIAIALKEHVEHADEL